MENLKPFHLIILAVFAVFAAAGIAIFAGVGGFFESDGGSRTPVTVWGTVNQELFNTFLNDLRGFDKNAETITYIRKDPRRFEEEFVEALAEGVGPDLLLLSHDLVLPHGGKLIVVPYESYSERNFKDTFVEEGELFLSPTGVTGFPFLIDPLVMYWNRSLFSGAGVAAPPRFWDEFFLLAPKVTKRDQASNIVVSFTALGEYANIEHAKAILSALIMQTGNPVVRRFERGNLVSTLSGSGGAESAGAEAALRFYTEFSNPVKATYSWNRALPNSRTMFLAGDLGVYFGFAGELNDLRRANPNLNFDVAALPQSSRDVGTSATYGALSAFVIPRTAPSPNAAFAAVLTLTGRDALSLMADLSELPPVRRDLLGTPQTDAYKTIFYASALQSRGWLDPDQRETDRIFRAMVESVTSGRERLSGAIGTAHAELSNLLR